MKKKLYQNDDTHSSHLFIHYKKNCNESPQNLKEQEFDNN